MPAVGWVGAFETVGRAESNGLSYKKAHPKLYVLDALGTDPAARCRHACDKDAQVAVSLNCRRHQLCLDWLGRFEIVLRFSDQLLCALYARTKRSFGFGRFLLI